MDNLAFVREAVKRVPYVLPLLSNKTRWKLHEPAAYKSAEYMTAQVRRLVTSLYSGYIGGEFIDTMANLISGQLYDAYSKAWSDYGEAGALPTFLDAAYQEDVLRQYDYVDQYYRDIVDARVDGTPIDPLLVRANMWGNRWNDSYSRASSLITQEMGGNMVWKYGDTDHCETCRALDGIVASAKEWEQAGVKPQNAPNKYLECGGWLCQCSLTPTTARRSPKAFDSILNAVAGGIL